MNKTNKKKGKHMKEKIAAMTAVAGFVLGLAVLSSPAANTPVKISPAQPPGHAGRLGKIEPAQKLIGREVHTLQNEKFGKLDDLVVDLESGRILYGVVSMQNGKVGVPPQIFSQMAENQPLMVHADKQKLTSAPRFTTDLENNLAAVNFATEVYHHFGQASWWEGAAQPTGRTTFGNVHKAKTLTGVTVKDSANQTLGNVNNIIVDLPDGRLSYVLLSLSGVPEAAQFLYPLPPNALTAGSDAKTLVTGLDRQKLQSGPKVPKNNLQQLSDLTFAASVYDHYGKQPYWNSGAGSPTGRTP